MTSTTRAPRSGRPMVGLALAAALLVSAIVGCAEPRRDRTVPTVTPSPSATASSPSTASSPNATPSPTSSPAASVTAVGTTAAGTPEPVIVPPSPTGTRYSYACAEGKTFAILAYPAAQERVTLFIEGRTLELKQERSGSGTRHSDGTVTLVSKGVDAFIEQNGVQTYRDCKGSRP